MRNINYTLYHSEKKKFEHQWGPLVYIHSENDVRLRTWNIICEMDENMRIKKYNHIDTSKHPDKELWEFVGLEDVCVFRWEEKLSITKISNKIELSKGSVMVGLILSSPNGTKYRLIVDNSGILSTVTI